MQHLARQLLQLLLATAISGDGRNERRQRVLSLLQTHETTPSPRSRVRFSFTPSFSGSAGGHEATEQLPPIFNTWVTWEWSSQSTNEPSSTSTPTTTPAPTPSPYDLWYYQDDSNNVQGPYSSFTMLEWFRAGYFRNSLLIRREVDNVFTALGVYQRLYGRVPFSAGAYPDPIIVVTTTSTTTTTTTTTTKATTTSTQRPRVTAPLLDWTSYHEDTSEGVSLNRADVAIVPLEEQEGERDEVEWGGVVENGETPSLKDGTIRLTGGRDDAEGNVEIYHLGVWGGICDDEWDRDEAKVACQMLGFPGAIAAVHGSRYGYTPSTIWMDNLYCYGTEDRLDECRFDGWGKNDCERVEAAGVKCEQHPPSTTTSTTTTAMPKLPMASVSKDMDVRLAGGRTAAEGRLEMRFDGGPWGVACGDGWGVREAMVACRQLGLRYASSAISTSIFGGQNMTRVVSGLDCNGEEESLIDCDHDNFGDLFCPGEGLNDLAGVVCTDTQADLEPDLYQLMTSAYLEDKPLFLLQCAMEENCVAKQAYLERTTNPYWQTHTRRLLRFTTAITNSGSADFRPAIPKLAWDWHACHQHYHSMEVFSHFEIMDQRGRRVVEGHKASFCLEDNDCEGVEPNYDCANYGDQGITAGCKDIYYYNIDCQWIDITDLDVGTYTFKMSINPEYKVPEITFENNAAFCTLYYSQMTAVINNCTLVRP